VQNNFYNFDVEISSILTVYVYISDNIYLMTSKSPRGGREYRLLGIQWYVVGWSVVV